MKEVWKSISGFEGSYEVSNLGRVKSLERWSPPGRGHRLQPEIILKAKLKREYLEVSLYKDGASLYRLVHHLVLEAFVGHRPGRAVTRHLDGNPINNQPSNLVWGTHIENSADQVKHGTWVHGEKQGGSKLKAEQVSYIRRSSMRQVDLATKFGVSQQLISKIKCNGCWSHL